MIIHCERCETRFELDDSRLAGSGLSVRCSHCKHSFWLEAPDASVADSVELAVSEALEPAPAVTEDLLGELDTELAGDENWEFAEPSGAPDELEDCLGAAELFNAEALGECVELGSESEPPAPVPLPQDGLLAVPDAVEEVATAPVGLGDSRSPESGAEDIEDALAALSAWEPEGEDPPQSSLPIQRARPESLAAAPVAHSVEAAGLASGLAWGGTLAGWMAVFVLVAVGLHSGVFAEARPHAALPQVSELGGYRLSEVRTRWIDNLHHGPLLVVSGRMLRVGDTRAARLELTLLDAEGAGLGGRGAALGPALALEVLRAAAPLEIRQRQAALRDEQATLVPGESRRFAAIFEAVPDAASELQVRLLEE